VSERSGESKMPSVRGWEWVTFGGLLFLLALTIPGLAAGRELVDGIAAVVGNQIILESEIDEELYIYQMRAGAPIPDDQVSALRGQILKEMMDEMLLVAKAKRDSISLAPGELEGEIERRVADVRDRQGSQEALDAALAAQGLTLEKLKEIYRDDVERRLLAEKVVREEVQSKIDVTWKDVDAYYAEHTEEVARVPERFEIGGILVAPKVSEALKRKAIDRLNEARARIDAGEPFETVAQNYSEDLSARNGGDLGTFERGGMVPEFEEAVFALNPGEMSGIVTTRFGYHIIQLISKDDSKAHARHILVKAVPGPDDDARAKAAAESLRQRVLAGEDMSVLARERSDDPATRENGGVLGWFAADELTPGVRDAVVGLPVGGVADVVKGDLGYYVLKLLAHEPETIASLDEVRDQLRDYLFNMKAEEAYKALIDRLSQEVYTDVRTETPPAATEPEGTAPAETTPAETPPVETAPRE
jgi:peptidyl-prolyl cis-trans isomerase SurA